MHILGDRVHRSVHNNTVPTPIETGGLRGSGWGLCGGGLGEGGPWNQPLMERRVLPVERTSDT